MRDSSTKNAGLKSIEYGSRNRLLILGIIVFSIGVAICTAILPDALSNKHYPMILFMASLPCNFLGSGLAYVTQAMIIESS